MLNKISEKSKIAEVFVQLLKRGYKRSYGPMVKQIGKIPKV